MEDTNPPVDNPNTVPSFITDGDIDFSKVANPVEAGDKLIASALALPNPSSVSLDTNRQLQGDYHTGPVPGAKPVNQKKGTFDVVSAIVNQAKDPNTVRDRFKYAKTYSFGSGYKDYNFDRYYTHPNFDKLGFSPYRDNESIYNDNSSWWSDFRRMGNQFGPLAWSGFKSIWGDASEAQENMDRRMAIGSSSQDGFGGWMTNFAMNSAYTVGIMAELATEDAILGLIEGATFGAATPVVAPIAGARNAMGFGRIARAWSGTSKAFKALKSFDMAKDFYQTMKVGDKAVDIAKWANPFARSFETGADLIKGTNGFKNMSNLAKTARSAGSFYRDIRELQVAYSESGIEGWGASRDYQNQLIDDYYNEHGEMPDDAAAKLIYDQAQSVRAASTTANMFTIYFTNKLVFNHLFEGVRPGAKALGETFRKVGKGVRRVEATDFRAGQGLVQEGAKLSKYQRAKDILFKSAYNPLSRKYLLENLGEGLQETSQEIIHGSVIDYYDNIKKDPSQSSFYGALAAVGRGAGDQFSAEGLNTFLSGYLMGGLIGMSSRPLVSTIDYAQSFINGTQTQKQQQRENDEKTKNDITNAVNFVADNALIIGDKNVNLGTAVKQAYDMSKAAAENGDTKAAYDMTDEMQLNHFEMLARTDSVGIVTEHIDDMLALDDSNLADAYGLTADKADEVRDKLNTFKDRVLTYEKNYKTLKKQYPNPFNPHMFSKKNKDGSYKYEDAYRDELDGYLAHEDMMSDILFASEDYKRIADRMKSIGDNLTGRGGALQNIITALRGGTPVANAAGMDVSLLIDPEQRSLEIAGLTATIQGLREGTGAQQREADLLQTKLDLLREWNNVSGNFATQLKSEDRAKYSPEEAKARTESARMRPGAKIKDKNGNEYVVYSSTAGKVTVKTKDGKMKTFSKKNVTVSQDAKGLSPGEVGAVTGDETDFAIYEMYDVFDQYIRHIAKIKKGEVFDEQLNKAFSMIKDMMYLEKDHRKIIHTLNELSNPDVRNQVFNLKLRLQKIKRERDAELVQQAYEEFIRRMKGNKMLNELFGIGVYVLPEAIDVLVKEFRAADFYDVTSKEKIPYNSPKYKEALDIIERYAQEQGMVTRGRAIPESRPEVGFDSYARPKFGQPGRRATAPRTGRRDERTYNDLAAQYGFDPQAESSPVDTQDVLKSIINSEFATSREKALAQRLLTAVAPGTAIRFVTNLKSPGEHHSSSTVNETYIDARYTSADYAQGENSFPIEHVILHELLHSVTVESLKTDTKFKQDIENLLELVRKNQAPGTLPLYGTKNAEEFVAEALTNDTFQAILKEINIPKASGKPSSAWDNFMSILRRAIKAFLGNTVQDTALDEALYIITTSIDKFEESRTKPDETITNPVASKVAEIRNKPILFEQLVNAYRAESEKGVALGELPKESVTGSDDEIASAEDFRRFVEESVTALEIIKNYNTVPQPAARSTTPEKYQKGKEFMFTGTSVDGQVITNEPVRVADDAGEEQDEDTGELTHLILLKNINTQKIYTVDIHSTNELAKAFRTSPIKKEKEEVKVAVAPTQQLIDKGIRLGFTEAQIIAMTPAERDQIRNAKTKEDIGSLYDTMVDSFTNGNDIKPELPITEEDVPAPDLMDAYNDITNKDQLEAWENQALFTLTNLEEKENLLKRHGIDLTSDVVRNMVQEKITALKESLKFEDLVPGTVVVTKTRQILVVKEITDRDVVLVSEEDYRTDNPKPGKTFIDKHVIKDFIDMIKNEFTTTDAEPIVTLEEKVESDNELKEVQNDVDPALIDEAMNSDTKSVEDAAANAFKNCKF